METLHPNVYDEVYDILVIIILIDVEVSWPVETDKQTIIWTNNPDDDCDAK